MASVKKNYLYSVFYQLLSIIVPIITSPYLSRVLGATTLGTYAFTNSIAYYFFLVSMLGMANYGSRSIAQSRHDGKQMDKTFNELFEMQLSWGAIVLLAYLLFIACLYIIKDDNFVLYAVWVGYVASGVLDISWYFWGIENFKITVIRNTVIKLITTIGIFIFVKQEQDLPILVLLIAGGSLFAQIILWFSVKDKIHFEKVSLDVIGHHLKANFKLFIPVLAVSVYTIMDKVMLGILSPYDQVGKYDNSQKILTIPTGLITALGAVMLPRMASLLSTGKREKAMRYLGISMQFSCFFSIAFAFGLAAIAPVFAPVYWGSEFIECSMLIALFSITVPFISWANVIRTQYLIPYSLDTIYIISVVVGACVNVIVNALLIPILSAVGAVIGTICSEVIVALIQTICVRKQLPVFKYFKTNVIYCIPGVIMFLLVRQIGWYFGYTVFSLVICILIGVVVYIGIATPMLIKSKTDLSSSMVNYLKKYLPNRGC